MGHSAGHWVAHGSRGGASSRLALMRDPSTSPPPVLLRRDEPAPVEAPARRTKIWEFNTNLHCSIIGTCLSTAELRQTLKKLGLARDGASDHELHGVAVSLVARHDVGAKMLHKALDSRHRLAIHRFDKARDEAALRALWRDAVRTGDIPGAYWAALTHAAATQAVIREAFGDVHMLSHLVGSANRADIRRLCQLEAEKAALEEKLARQQAAMHDAITARDQTIRDLQQALARRIETETHDAAPDDTVLRGLVADMERRFTRLSRRADACDARLADSQAAMKREHALRMAAERHAAALQAELDALEPVVAGGNSPDAALPLLSGLVLLYVGGRPNQISHLRAVAGKAGATLLHHDGGVEDQPALLPGLASRADVVLFPVDCISHDAANTVKTVCRQSGKRFLPLRSASTATLLAALRRPDVRDLADAAD